MMENRRATVVADPRITRFEALYREHFGFVWAAARGLGAPEAALPDVVQEVFVAAYRRQDEIDLDWVGAKGVGPRGWLYAVTRRMVFRVRRTAARATRRELALRRLPDDVAEPHGAGDAAVDLARMLDALDPSQREVLVMADLLGMSGPEMATQIGAPLDTVYSRLRLARGRVQRLARATALEAAAGELRRVPDGARARCWLAIAPALSPAVPATIGGLGLAKLGLSAAAIVAAIAWAVTPSRAPAPSPTPAEPPTIATTIGSTATTPATSAIAPSTTPPVQPVAVTPAPESTPIVARAPAGGARPTTSPPASPSASRGLPEPTGIDAELAALERAGVRLDADDPAGALAILDATRGADPDGQLADARGALRVRALCGLGRVAAAEREAEALRRAFPTSRVAAASRCEGA